MEISKSMQFYFIRHGQSENNALWKRTGSSKGRSEDPGLTEVGQQQAEFVAQFLRRANPLDLQSGGSGGDIQNVAGFGITHLYSSLMVRSVATGTAIAKALDLPLVAWALGEAGWWNRPFEESEQRPIRAQRFLGDLMERHGDTDDQVAVVGHGGFYNDLLAAILNLPEGEGYWFALSNAAISRIDFDNERIGLVYLNRLGFLPKELVT
jgi:2,3-bisphosphoglycerate-dependent phosphoglycerate mutase